MQHGVPGQRPDERKRRNQYEYDHLFKFLLLGDSGVGKSCLLLRYADDAFTTSFITTIGVDFKTVTRDIDDKRIKLQIWDTVGQDRFRTIANNSCRGVHGIVIAFDMTDEQSFQNVRNWISHVERHASENVSVVLVGTKSDLVSEQVVTPQRAQELASTFNIPFIMTSAKSNVGVDAAFTTLAHKVFNEQFKPKVQPAPVPATTRSSQPETIGIGRQIGNFFLWPFKKIWAGLKFIGRGFLAVGRGFASIFHRSQSNGAQQPLAAGSPELKKTSAEIAADYQRAQGRLTALSNQHNPPASLNPGLATVVVPATASIQELERQRSEAKLRAEIAALERQKAVDEEKTAVSKQQKTRAELDEVAAKALLARKLAEQEQQERARNNNDAAVGPGEENNNNDNSVGPA